METKRINSSKQRNSRTWIGCSVLFLGAPFLLYFGYCWGLWGQHSLLLQYLFQCNCPPFSEEARYPRSVDVIVSACQHVNSRLSPSGRLLHVQETESGPNSTYLLNIQTFEKIPFSLPDSAFYFLNDNLLYFFVYYEGNEYILDRTNNMKYPLQRFITLEPNAYSYGQVNPDSLIRAILRVETVFLIDTPSRLVIALSSDFRTYPQHSFVFDGSDLPGKDKNQVEQFLKRNNITYYHIAAPFPDEAVSPDGRFIARPDGIYLVDTGERIVAGYSASRSYRGYSGKYFDLLGWAYNSTEAIYSELLNPCLIETTFFVYDDYNCFIEVAQPVIKLKVPEEYLSSHGTEKPPLQFSIGILRKNAPNTACTRTAGFAPLK